VGEEVLKHLCSGLFVLGKLPEVFGTTNLGKCRNCLDANERFFITYTLHECGPQGVVYVLADERCDENATKEEEHVLEFTEMRNHLRNEAYNAVAHVFVFCLEAFEKVFEQTISKARRSSFVVIVPSFLLFQPLFRGLRASHEMWGRVNERSTRTLRVEEFDVTCHKLDGPVRDPRPLLYHKDAIHHVDEAIFKCAFPDEFDAITPTNCLCLGGCLKVKLVEGDKVLLVVRR